MPGKRKQIFTAWKKKRKERLASIRTAKAKRLSKQTEEQTTDSKTA